MARGTEEQEQTAGIGSDFPYLKLMNHAAWAVVDEALADLESNGDLELQTARRYVVGSLVKALADKGLLPPNDPDQLPANERGGRYRWIYEFKEQRGPKKQAAQKKAAK